MRLEETIVSGLPSLSQRNVWNIDSFELLSGLCLCWIGRLPTIDIVSCHKDEIKEYREAPVCVSLEAVKIRYLMESKLERLKITLQNKSLFLVHYLMLTLNYHLLRNDSILVRL